MLDHKGLGLKTGLEIHQQLDGKKLFCKCSVNIQDTKPDFEIQRNLRASQSELGKLDKASLYELKKGKYFVYQGYNNSNCLVELDESPPEELNKEALKIAVQVSLLLNAKVVDEIQFMRKIVLDGSNVSSFQRTALVGINGYIETSEGKIRIPTICLEEEAAKKIEDTNEYRKYNISRLGIALIEIATAPDIKTPEGAKEAAEKIGMILRSVNGIKRGLGSIRQDVNVSIKGGARTEIKGFQDLRSIPKVIEFEITRQLDLVNSNKKVEESVRKAESNLTTSYLRPMPGANRMYPETDVKPIEVTKEYLNSINLPKLISQKVEDLENIYKISSELAKELIKNNINFGEFVSDYRNISPSMIAHILIEIPKEIKTRLNLDINNLDMNDYHSVLTVFNENKISKEAVIRILEDKIKTGEIDFSKYEKLSDQVIEEEIKKIINENKDVPFGALMGMAMKKFNGKVDGKKVSEIIKKLK